MKHPVRVELTGADEFEAAQCDMVVDGAQDLLLKLRPFVMAMFSGDNEKKMIDERLQTYRVAKK